MESAGVLKIENEWIISWLVEKNSGAMAVLHKRLSDNKG